MNERETTQAILAALLHSEVIAEILYEQSRIDPMSIPLLRNAMAEVDAKIESERERGQFPQLESPHERQLRLTRNE